MMNKKEIASTIAAATASLSKSRGLIQTAMCHIAGHVYDHGNVALYKQLFSDDMRGTSRQDLLRWINEYGFARWSSEKECFLLDKRARDNADFVNGESAVQWLSASATAWWIKPETVGDAQKALDVAKRLTTLAASIDKARTEGKVIVMADVEKAMAKLNNSMVMYENNQALDKAHKEGVEHTIMAAIVG